MPETSPISESVVELDRLVSAQWPADPPTIEDAFSVIAERGLLPGGVVEDSLEDFIGHLPLGPAADLLAAALLRMLGLGAGFSTTPARVRVARFLDESYGDRLTQYYTPPPKRRDARDTIHRLAGVAPALERRAREMIAQLADLGRVVVVRTELLRLINSPTGQTVLRPFLPDRPAASVLKDVFDAAVYFKSNESDDMSTAHAQLQSLTQRLTLESQQMGTSYTKLLFGGVASELSKSGRGSFEYQQPPARLRMHSKTKPLPLDEAGVTCSAIVSVQNHGEAPAHDVAIEVLGRNPNVATPEAAIQVGTLTPGAEARVDIPITILNPSSDLVLPIQTRWTNLDQTTDSETADIDVQGQAADIDWERLAILQPFAPYPVEDPQNLVGRDEELGRLVNQFSIPPLDNLFVTGQRRVGKTSLVRALLASLRDRETSTVISHVELGEARHGGSKDTIAELGRRLAQRALRDVGLQDEIPVPEFSDSLAPLIDVVESIRDLDSKLSFLFVIDEFDELPNEVYRRDGPGDALFLPIRSLAQTPYVGWILVGGESMPFIRDEQAHRLNTFSELDLGYLDQSADFAALIVGPLPDGMEVEAPAVRAIHTESSGNPHFAKEIAANLFRTAVRRRDAVVTAAEVDEAADVTAKQKDLELFAHFWEDGIFEREEERRRRELQRRMFLTALADLLRTGKQTSSTAIATACDATDLPDWQPSRTEGEFVRRQILAERTGLVRPAVPLFRRWLETEGYYKLPPRGVAEQAGSDLGRRSREAQVTSEEIGRLLDRWSDFQYQGQKVRREDVETWLAQFETFKEQRLMFRLLERFRVVSEAKLRSALRQLQGSIHTQRSIRLEQGQRTLSHILVSWCGPSGGSGPAYAGLYRQANNIRRRNVKPRSEIAASLEQDGDIRSVVLVDDFLGSGQTARKALDELFDSAQNLENFDVDWFVFAVAGLESGIRRVESSDAAKRLKLRAEVADSIQPHDLPFHQQSSVFSGAAERRMAEEVAARYGTRLWSAHPLGISNGQALVAFPNNCPNNAPPIFWSDRKGWRPLFRRTGVS